VIGNPVPNAGFTIPLGFTGQAGDQYQQIYESSGFVLGPVSISQVAFASSPFPFGPASYDITVGISTTSASCVMLPPAYSPAIRGTDFTVVFSGTISVVLAGDGTFDLSIPFTTPFPYDPSAGDLLLDVVINSNGAGAFEYDTSGAQSCSAYNTSLFGPSNSNVGLVTQFEFTIAAVPIEVAIDIKPGAPPNSINPRSRGVIPVAILTNDTFDAITVDPSTVRFGATGTEAAPEHFALQDVNGDGKADMILQFKTQETGIVCGNTSASLTGKTVGGQAINGSDSIRTVGC
jgi:hypothetical protein